MNDCISFPPKYVIKDKSYTERFISSFFPPFTAYHRRYSSSPNTGMKRTSGAFLEKINFQKYVEKNV